MALLPGLGLSAYSIMKIEQLFEYKERLEEFCPEITYHVREDFLDMQLNPASPPPPLTAAPASPKTVFIVSLLGFLHTS